MHERVVVAEALKPAECGAPTALRRTAPATVGGRYINEEAA